MASLLLLTAFFSSCLGALPPGYEDELYCPEGRCRQLKKVSTGFVGPATAFHECALIAGGGDNLPVEAWGSNLPLEDKVRLLDTGHHLRTCKEVRGASQGSTQDLWEAGSLGRASTVIVQLQVEGKPRPMELQYFAIRGLAELPRLILEESKTPYIGIYYGRQDFTTHVKPTLPLGRVPVLRNFDGRDSGRESILAQSEAIVRHLARQTNLAGAHNDVVQIAHVDMLFETHQELFVSHKSWGQSFDPRALKEANGKALSFGETSNGGNYTRFQTSLAALTTFETQLERSSGPYLLGQNITYVDLALWLTLVELEEEDNFPGALQALGLTRLVTLRKAVEERPAIQAYINSDRRMPRIVKVDGDYKYIAGHFELCFAAVGAVSLPLLFLLLCLG